MAELQKIEKLIERAEKRGQETEPYWIRGYEQRDMHLSGALREAAFDAPDGLAALLEEAAETLDDAHQDFLEVQDEAYCAFSYNGAHTCQWCKR